MTANTTNIHGREYTTLAGLLSKAHEDGLNSISTKVLALPYENDLAVAIVQATVITSKGTFQAVGDASAENVGQGIEIHLVRMAETRAIARALRWATNSASTAEEEVDPSHPVQAFDRRVRGTGDNGNGQRKVTSRQIALITRLLREADVRQEEFRQQVQERFEGKRLEDLSTREASTVIEELMAVA